MNASVSTRKSADWAALAVVMLSITAFSVAQGLTYPLISLTLESRGVSASLIGLNAATFAAGLGAAVLIIDRLTRRVRGDHLIVLGLFGCSACLAAFSATDALWVWFAARFLLGFFASLIFILSEAWMNAAAHDRIRGRVSGVYGAGMCAGFAAGPLAIPILGTAGGFAFAFVAVYVALVGFAAVACSAIARTAPEAAPGGALMQFAKAAPVLLLMVLVFGLADIAAISGMPIYFVRQGHSEAFAAYAVTVLALPTAFAQPLVGWLLDKAPRDAVAAGCALLAAVTFLLIPHLEKETAILILFAIMGAAAFGLFTSALAILGERFTGGMLVAGSAAFSMAYAIGSATGSSGSGLAMDLISPSAAPTAVGLVLLCFGIFLALRIAWRRTRREG